MKALLVLSLLLCLAGAAVNAKVITVSTEGPLTTVTAAAAQAVAGDTIEITGGVYTAKENMWFGSWLNGTADAPITITAAPGASVVFDGSGTSGTLFSMSRIAFVRIVGPIEIRNANASGLVVTKAFHVEITGVHVHHTWEWALAVSGDDIHIHDNEFENCVMHNEHSQSTTGWKQCVASWGISDTELSRNIVWEDNKIHESWGESLDVILCDNCIARRNHIVNGFSVMLYADNVQNVLIEANHIEMTDDAFRRSDWSWPTAIAVGMETWPANPIPCVNVTIRNNVGHHTGTGVASWGWEGYYSQIKIYGNTFWDTTGAGISFNENTVLGQTKENEARNNVFFISNRWWAGSIASADKSSWRFSANVWFGMPSVPLQDTDGANTSVAFPAGTDAQLLFSGTGCSGNLTGVGVPLRCFTPASQGPLDGKGTPIPSNKKDYFGCARSSTAPCIGFAERVCSDDGSGGGGGGGGGGDDDASAEGHAVPLFVVALVAAMFAANN